MADPLGRAMYDCHRGAASGELVYRDGDTVAVHDVAATYFEPPEAWSTAWTDRLDALEGPVLDVGCGAAKYGRWLQDRGREVVGIDRSPYAVRTARERGLADVREMDMFDLEFGAGRFRSVLVIGTQLGLAGSLPGVRVALSDLAHVTDAAGTAIVDSYDPTGLDQDGFIGYRPDPRPGVARRSFHFEYRRPDGTGPEIGPSLSFVLFSPDRLRDVVIGTPWSLAEVDPRDGYYRARLEKRQSGPR